MKPIAQRVGRQIMIRRTELELDQGELARAVGISQAHLSNLEHGRRTIDIVLLEKIAGALHCRIANLLPPEENRPEAA